MIQIDRYKCGYCGACVGVCKFNALELVETWIDIKDGCTECGVCSKVCPVGALSLPEEASQ